MKSGQSCSTAGRWRVSAEITSSKTTPTELMPVHALDKGIEVIAVFHARVEQSVVEKLIRKLEVSRAQLVPLVNVESVDKVGLVPAGNVIYFSRKAVVLSRG